MKNKKLRSLVFGLFALRAAKDPESKKRFEALVMGDEAKEESAVLQSLEAEKVALQEGGEETATKLAGIIDAIKSGDAAGAITMLEEVIASLMPSEPAPQGDQKPAPAADQKPAPQSSDTVPEAVKAKLESLTNLVGELSSELMASHVTQAVADAPLPAPSKERVTQGLLATATITGKRPTEKEIREAIAKEQDYLAKITGQPVDAITGQRVSMSTEIMNQYPSIRAKSLKEDAIIALDAMWLNRPLKTPDGHRIQPFNSLKEAARVICGVDVNDNREFIKACFGNGYDSGEKNRQFWNRQNRFTMSIASAGWSTILGDSITRVALREYMSPEYNYWRQFVSDFSSPKDFKNQTRYTWGGYGVLPTVAKGAPYQPLTTPGQEAGTFAISKKGGLEQVHLEDLANDDMNELRKLPKKLGAAGALTILDAFVTALIACGTAPGSGGTDYLRASTDALALFHASHSNTGTTALSRNALKTIKAAMRRQVARQASAKAFLAGSNLPKILLVPPELEETAEILTNGKTLAIEGAASGEYNVTGGAFLPDAGIPNPHAGLAYVVSELMSDTTDYYVCADPSKMPTIEFGFWNGQQEPEIFTEAENGGSVFSADVYSYKIRHVWGFLFLDYRSWYREVVA